MKPPIFASARRSSPPRCVRDETHDIPQRPVFAALSGQNGREMKLPIFDSANRHIPRQWVRDETPDIRQMPVFAGQNGPNGCEMKHPIFVKSPYFMARTAKMAAR
jgi:hypothetical protein